VMVGGRYALRRKDGVVLHEIHGRKRVNVLPAKPANESRNHHLFSGCESHLRYMW
jgi:hypothetical protein